MSKHPFSSPSFAKIVSVLVIIAVAVPQWLCYQPGYAHDSAATPVECVAAKAAYERAKRAHEKAVGELLQVESDAMSELWAGCIINGAIVFLGTFIVTGNLGAAAILGGLTCAGSMVYSVVTTTPGLERAEAKVRDTKSVRDAKNAIYQECMYNHFIREHTA